jgi:Ca2+-binding RTX toxin-like protein
VAVLAAAALTTALASAALAADPEVAARKLVVTCGGKVATKVGTPGPDRLVGTPRRDIIAGLGGNDTIYGLGGNDVLCGGSGHDRLFGGPGRDTLLGQTGRDRLRGGTARDRLFGGAHADRLFGQGGPDLLLGGPGNDRLVGGAGIDTCYQNSGQGALLQCELPAPPPAPTGPTLIPLDGIHAIAYSDVDGLDGYSTGDVLIAALVDTVADGVPGWGDKVVLDRYPTNLEATAFAGWGVTEHHGEIPEIYTNEGRTFHITMRAANGDYFDWYHGEGTFTYDWYQEAGTGTGGVTEFFDTIVSPDPIDDDSMFTEQTSPSQPTSANLDLDEVRQRDDAFIDVEIVYQEP